MWWLISLTTLPLTLPYRFIHSSQLEFRNLDCFLPYRSIHRKFWFKILNSKIRYHTATLWACYCMWWLIPSLPCLWHYLTFSITPLSSSFRILIFSSRVVAYIVSFHSRSWTRKSDIIRQRNELFKACGGSCSSLPCLWYNITLPFHSLLSAGF